MELYAFLTHEMGPRLLFEPFMERNQSSLGPKLVVARSKMFVSRVNHVDRPITLCSYHLPSPVGPRQATLGGDNFRQPPSHCKILPALLFFSAPPTRSSRTRTNPLLRRRLHLTDQPPYDRNAIYLGLDLFIRRTYPSLTLHLHLY